MNIYEAKMPWIKIYSLGRHKEKIYIIILILFVFLDPEIDGN